MVKKYLFIDKDDVMINSSPLIQGDVNRNSDFKTSKLRTIEYQIAALEMIYQNIEAECQRAKELYELPELGSLFKKCTNDVIRDNNNNYDAAVYEMPVTISRIAYQEALREKEAFMEARDCLLENDNLLPREKGIINYDDIYTMKHINRNVIETVNEIRRSNYFNGVFELSHHNGGREEIAKQRLNYEMFGYSVPFLGTRFHIDEQGTMFRRPRNSKALFIMSLFTLENLEGCYLVDDSMDNLKEWKKYGGGAILYRPLTAGEKYSKYIDEYPRVATFNKQEIMDAVEIYENDKVLIKTIK